MKTLKCQWLTRNPAPVESCERAMSLYCHTTFTVEGAPPEWVKKMREIAVGYFRSETLPACGWVMIHEGVPFGWSLDPDPSHHVPGVVAAPYFHSEPMKVACDGDAQDGAKEWAMIVETTKPGGAQ